VSELKSSDKPFDIPKWVVWEAYQRVKANRGAAGVDGQSIEDFEKDRDANLYRIWNRMSSGSYFPPPVRAVEIPKTGGGVRVLGVPTVADRVAQTVVARFLEAKVEPIFHQDSYGYRPGRSALDAVATCRQRCWKYDWVIDLDIQKFFDSVPWELMLKAVARHTDQRWVLLYVQRWLEAPLQQTNGTLVVRDRGTPQGSAISPVLANLFMHYAFDAWMEREFPRVGFERYVDDAVVHCTSRSQAEMLVKAIGERMEQVGLVLHSTKTKVVYCKGGRRQGSYEHTAFTFLGYTFRANYRYSTNPQVAIDADTRLVIAIGDPRPGNRNDCTVYRDSGIADVLEDRPVMADGGYQGNPKVIMPYRKPRDGSPLTDWQEDLNTVHRSIVPAPNTPWPA
jgi:group II intron reverse transcriptase/maturase